MCESDQDNRDASFLRTEGTVGTSTGLITGARGGYGSSGELSSKLLLISSVLMMKMVVSGGWRRVPDASKNGMGRTALSVWRYHGP